MSLSPGENPSASARSLRATLTARANQHHDVRVTEAELEDAERVIATLFAAIVKDPKLQGALTASASVGAAPRPELPLCRDVVLSLDTAIGLAAAETDPND